MANDFASLFCEVFSELRASLEPSSLASESSSADVMRRHRMESLFRKRNMSLSSTLTRDHAKNTFAQNLQHMLSEQLETITLIKQIHTTSTERAVQISEFERRQIQSHYYSALRRLRELLFEIMGEYGKAIARSGRRQEYVCRAQVASRFCLVHCLNWERFTQRLLYDVIHYQENIRCLNVSYRIIHCNHNEYHYVASQYYEKLSTTASVTPILRILKIIRVVPPKLAAEVAKHEVITRRPPITISKRSDMRRIVHELNRWVTVPSRVSTAAVKRAVSNTNPVPIGQSNATLKLRQFLNSNNILWCHSSRFGTYPHSDAMDNYWKRSASQVVNSRMYYCVEERMLAEDIYPNCTPRGELYDPAVYLLQYIQFIYVPETKLQDLPSLQNIRETLATETLSFVQYLSQHRRVATKYGPAADMLSSFPDIIQAKSSSGLLLHFIPAIILNLPELTCFKSQFSTSDHLRAVANICPHPQLPYLCSPSTSLPLDTFYNLVSLPTEAQALYMQPLSKACLLHVFKSYFLPEFKSQGLLLPEWQDSSLSHLELLPDDCLDTTPSDDLNHQYTLIGVDTEGISGSTSEIRKEGKHCYYLIQSYDAASAEYTASEALQCLRNHIASHIEENAVYDANKANAWNTALYGTLCRWRSCLAESCAAAGNKYLCRYHYSLKLFLDKDFKGNGIKESAKYLPKKSCAAVTQRHRDDMSYVRNVSSLLQELWDGKLRATVTSYAEKTRDDLGLRKRCDALAKYAAKHRLDEVVIESPIWTKWRDEAELHRALSDLAVSREILDKIGRVEKELTSELQLLADMKIFPSAEIVIIRREAREFDKVLQKQSESTAETGTMLDQHEAEYALAERKLSIIRSKRLDEEETRQNMKKKLQRAKQLEESQSRDPANFNYRKSHI